MKKTSYSVNDSVDNICRLIESICRDVLETKAKKEKKDKAIIYYPARRFMGMDDLMDDVSIIIRTVNSNICSVKLEHTEYLRSKGSISDRLYFLDLAYDKLKHVLDNEFTK